MDKDVFDKIRKGAKQAADYAHGKPVRGAREYGVDVARIDVKAIRKRLHMTRDMFCSEFRLSPRTVASWESGERGLDGAARNYMQMIDKTPDVVRMVMRRAD